MILMEELEVLRLSLASQARLDHKSQLDVLSRQFRYNLIHRILMRCTTIGDHHCDHYHYLRYFTIH